MQQLQQQPITPHDIELLINIDQTKFYPDNQGSQY